MSDDGKPAEMSFSDWKKMKNALNSTEEKPSAPNSKPKKGQAKKNANNYNNNRQNNNNNNSNTNNWGGNFDYREQQRLQYFQYLKQNQMLMMQAALSNMTRNSMVPFNNNMGAGTNNFGPFNNNRNAFNNNMNPYNNNNNNNMNPFNNNNNNMNQFNNNNMNQFNPGMNSLGNNMGIMPLMQQRNALLAQSQFNSNNRNAFNNHGFADNYMGGGNDFVSMSEMPIPQLPFRQNHNIPSLLSQQPFKQNKNIPPLMSQQPLKQNKNIPSLMSIRMQKIGIPVKKTHEPKPKESQNEEEGKDANDEAATTSKAVQKKIKSSKLKKNSMPNKPPMPPPVVALTPEAHEAKQKMWREYRQNVKPFKNKDFLNAKRVIQRLKKKPFEDLDEKEKERWEKANEFVNSHKKILTERAVARGEAASARAALVQNALHSENNSFTDSPQSGEPSSPLVAENGSVKNGSGQDSSQSANSNELPSTSGAAGYSTTSENWELWSSFVPGGVLFKS